jgi:hypothetical protein
MRNEIEILRSYIMKARESSIIWFSKERSG